MKVTKESDNSEAKGWTEYEKPVKTIVADGGRAFVEGVWDIMHSGHLNVFRQTRKLNATTSVTVGINEDDSVRQAKGAPPVYSAEERAKLVASSRYVDRVLVDYPYYNNYEQFLETGTDFICHGNDSIITPDGTHMYEPWVAKGQFCELARTPGISTSSLMYRMLDASKKFVTENNMAKSLLNAVKIDREGLQSYDDESENTEQDTKRYKAILDMMNSEVEEWGNLPDRPQQMLTSSARLGNFLQDNHRQRPENCDIVYTDGFFDVLHPGHIDLLNLAQEKGNWVVVGLFDDVMISNMRGKEFPILSLMERAIVLLSMKQVDEIIFGAPWILSKAYLQSNNIKTIIRREEVVPDNAINWALRTRTWEAQYGGNPYYEASKMGIEVIDVDMSFRAHDLYERLWARREQYESIIMNRIEKEQKIQVELHNNHNDEE